MLTLAEEVDVVALVPSSEAGMWHVLLLLLMLLLQLWLLVDGRREMRKGIGEVVAGETAAIACHCAMGKVLPLGSSCAMLLQQGHGHAVAGLERANDRWIKVALMKCAF